MNTTLLLVLSFIIIVTFSVLIIRFLIQFLKHDMKLTRYLIVAIYSISFGILYDSSRVISFILFGFLDETTDRFFFALKFFLIFIAVAAMIRIVFILNRQSGHEIKYDALIRYAIMGAIGVISAINIFTFTPEPISGFPGFFTYRINELLFFSIIAVTIPFLIYIFMRLRIFVKEIREKAIRYQMIFLGVVFVVLILERLYNLGHTFIPHSFDTLVAEFWLITFISISALVIFLKYPDLLELISTYFCVKSIYVIKKKGGQLLFGYDFHGEGDEDFTNPENLLLGGFIYAISRGLEVTLRLSGDLELIQIEDKYLIFKQGRFVVGLVFATEDLPATQFKLLLFLQKFERFYENSLRKWKGDLSEFQSETVMKWIYEIFRPVG